MTKLDANSLPESLTSVLTDRFYLDGTSATASLVFSKTFVFNTKLRGVLLKVLYPRTVGSLLVEFFKNNIAIPSSSLTINGTYPVSVSIDTLNVELTNGDTVTAKATTTALTPLKNACDIELFLQ